MQCQIKGAIVNEHKLAGAQALVVATDMRDAGAGETIMANTLF